MISVDSFSFSPSFLIIIGWAIIFYISHRASNRAEFRSDCQVISNLVSDLKQLFVERRKNNENIESEKERFNFDLFELDAVSKINRIETLSISLTKQLNLEKNLVAKGSLAALRNLLLTETNDKLYELYEVCEEIEDALLKAYYIRYQTNPIIKYKVELFVTVVFLGGILFIHNLWC